MTHDPACKGQSEVLHKLRVDVSSCAEKFRIWMGELGILEDVETDLPLDKDVGAYMHEHLDRIFESPCFFGILQFDTEDTWM